MVNLEVSGTPPCDVDDAILNEPYSVAILPIIQFLALVVTTLS